MSKGTKFILIVGDEGGILVQMEGGKVVRRLYAPSTDYTETRALLECLESDPKAPIYMVVDVMDQSYVQHALPPVSSISVNNLIKRKMERDFAADDIKGALRIGREKEGRRDWKYLFVSLSYSPQLQAWIELVIDLPNRFKGIYLLPVESQDFINELHDSITGKKTKPGTTEAGEPSWRLLVAHNKVGGFRQVVLKDGKLIFARLAQPIGEAQPAVIAGSIEQEISVTIEYLKRLSYTPEQGLQLYIVTSDAIKQSIDPKNIQATETMILTPHEVASFMKLEESTEPGDKYADIILASAFSKRKKHLLPLDTPVSKKLNATYGMIAGVKAAGTLLVIGAVCMLAYTGVQIPGVKSESENLNKQITEENQKLEATKKLEAELPEDLEKITDLVAVYQILNNLGDNPIQALDKYRSGTKGVSLFLKKFSWVSTDDLITAKVAGSADAAPAIDPATGAPAVADASQWKIPPNSLTISFDADVFETSLGTKKFGALAERTKNKLASQFTGYAVTIDSKLPGTQEDENLEVGIGTEGIDPLLAEKSFLVTYKVVGPLEEPKVDPNAPPVDGAAMVPPPPASPGGM